MRLQAAIQGDLQTLLKAELRGAERAVTAGVRVATLGLKSELRAQVTSAGLGQRLAQHVALAHLSRGPAEPWCCRPRLVQGAAPHPAL
jgi:hypothetical protein